MIKRIVAILLITGFIVINLYLFNKAQKFSEIYPFKRAMIGNLLTSKINMAESHLKFKSRITKIENEDADTKNVNQLLFKYKTKEDLNVTIIDTESKTTQETIDKTANNRDYLFFLLFLMLFGSINYIWGSVVLFIRPHEILPRVYFFFSIVTGFFYYNMVDQFTFGRFDIGLVIIILFIGSIIIFLGYYLTAQRINKYVASAISLFSLLMIIYSAITIFLSSTLDSIIFISLFVYLVCCSSFTLVKLIYGIIKNNNPFVIRRYLILFIGLFIGNLFPILNVLFSTFSNLGFPIYIYSSLILISPLIVGSAFIRYNQYDLFGFKIFQLNDIKLLSYNIIAAVLITILLHSLLTISDFTFYKILYAFVDIFVLLMLLNFLHFFISSIKSGYENKDNYAFSAQRVAELSSSMESLEYKLEHIFQEISMLTSAVSLKLIVFIDPKDKYYSSLDAYFEVLPKDSDLFSYISLNKGIIIKCSLIKNSRLEERIYYFLEDRKFILAIPIIENEEIKGAFLVGERKPAGFYSDADIHYFKTVSNQIFQLIESDWLYKDYILKKQYENELDNASYVQMRLFPKVSLDRDRGMDISFFYRPYLRVIGDYFDFFKVDEDRTAIIIGDVSGHGLSTAMILSAVNGITNAMLREVKAIEKACNEINNFLNKSYKGIELITLFIGIFNRTTKLLEYINAGHGAPLLIRKKEKKIQQIEGRTKILGADPDAEYVTSSVTLEKNDELILYTDGVMEIYNEDTGSGINEEDFIQIISRNMEKDVDNKIIEIEKSIKYHSEAIKDDITIIGVRIH